MLFRSLFTWSTTPDRSGSHRPYAVAALISLELQASNESCDVEAGFMKWVDGSVPERRRAGVVRELLSELIRVRAVSYSLYLQRMIARGETEEREGVVSPSGFEWGRGLMRCAGTVVAFAVVEERGAV